MTFDPKILARVARCFCFLPKTEVRAIIVYLLCQWAKSSEVCQHDTVDDWALRVVANGGASPSQNTLDALCEFMVGLDAAGLTSKMKAVNCLVPDSLEAAITPLIIGAGIDPWTNNGFVAADLTINGLNSLGNPRFLDTGVNPVTAFPDDLSAGITLYNLTPLNSTATDCGCLALPNRFDIYISSGLSRTQFQAFASAAGAGSINEVNSLWTGFISGSRTSANAIAIYRGKSTVPFMTLKAAGGSGGTRPNLNMYAFAGNDVNKSYSVRTMSFVAIHTGLTATETGELFNLVQAMRVNLGGGYL